MPGIFIDEKEIKAKGEGEINSSGNLYIDKGRRYANKKVRWFVMKEE